MFDRVTQWANSEIPVLISALLLVAASVRFATELRRVPAWKTLASAIGCLCLGSAATVLEHAAAYDFFNAVEHVAYFAQSALLAVWALRVRTHRRC